MVEFYLFFSFNAFRGGGGRGRISFSEDGVGIESHSPVRFSVGPSLDSSEIEILVGSVSCQFFIFFDHVRRGGPLAQPT